MQLIPPGPNSVRAPPAPPDVLCRVPGSRVLMRSASVVPCPFRSRVPRSCCRKNWKNCQADRSEEKKQPHPQTACYQDEVEITNTFGRFGRSYANEFKLSRNRESVKNMPARDSVAVAVDPDGCFLRRGSDEDVISCRGRGQEDAASRRFSEVSECNSQGPHQYDNGQGGKQQQPHIPRQI